MIILAGYVTQQCYDHLIEAMIEKFSTDVYDARARDIRFSQARAGKHAQVIGAALTILQNYP